MKPIILIGLVLLLILPAFSYAKYLISAEYFIDNDPGEGNGIPISGTYGDTTVTVFLNGISTIGLSYGSHTIFVRFQDSEGNWGQTGASLLNISNPDPNQKTITAAEFFIDSDPGEGNGTALSGTFASSTVTASIMGISTSDLSYGTHNVYVRFQDSEANWGQSGACLLNISSLYPENYIFGAEYFIDIDPGIGNGIPLLPQDGNFNSPTETAFLEDIESSFLSIGEHILSVRFQDMQENWSFCEIDSFEVIRSAPFADFTATPVLGKAPLMVAFTDQTTQGTGALEEWQWSFGDGYSSNEQNPTHIYENVGLFTVSLTVTDENDSTGMEIKTDYITVAEPHLVVVDSFYVGETPKNVSISNGLILHNDSVVDLEIIDLFTDNDEFSVVSDTSFTIPPDSLAEVTISFISSIYGEHAGILTINSDDPENETKNVHLSATILAAILIVDESLDFGILNLGEIKIDTLLVSNIGNIDLALSEITVFGDAFSLLSDNALIIPPDSSGEIIIKFEIYTPGSHSGAITWIDNDYVGIDSVSLIGSTIPVPVISFMNGNFNFGNVALNTSEDHEIIIKNTGTDTLYISEITISDTVFTLNYNTSITVLAPDDTLSVIVTFQPTSVGTFSAQLTVNDTINNLSNFTTVQGNGEGAILTTESIFNYPTVPIFSSTTSEISITNEGNIDLEITDMIFKNQLFETNIEFPFIVVPEFEATIPINYESNNFGEVEDTLIIVSNNYFGDKIIIIYVNSILPDIRIYVEGNIFIDSLDFGTVRSGDKIDTTFIIAHFEDENYQVTIDSIIISGSEASHFHNNTIIPFVLEYQNEYQINFEYQPQAIGNHKAITSFYSGGINLKDIVLSGNCIPNQSPNVSNLNLPSSIYTHDIEIQYELSDWENDTLALNLEFFVSDIWEEATLNMSLDNITPPNYSGVFMWLSNEDFKGYYENLPLRLVVSDHFSAVTNSETTNINLANLVGDLVFVTEDEIGVGFEDIIPFSDAWKTTGEIDNIGPITGTIPNVIPSDLSADQIIDFEDLCVFVQMWNWSAENLNFKYFGKIFLAKQGDDVEANIQYISDNNFDINISLNTEARAFELIMFLDSDFFEVVSISKSVENDNIILLSYQNERFLKVNIVNLDRSNLPTDKSLISFTINLTSDNNIFGIDGMYELRHSSNAILTNNLLNIHVDLSEFLPKEFILFQNYPNPFRLTTSIEYSLPKLTDIKLQIYNLKGQLVKTLVDAHKPAGYHTIEWNAKDMSSGIYFYKLTTKDKTFIKKMILMQ